MDAPTTATALWGAVALSGLYHGVNPGMGWPLAVSAALMERAPGSPEASSELGLMFVIGNPLLNDTCTTTIDPTLDREMDDVAVVTLERGNGLVTHYGAL